MNENFVYVQAIGVILRFLLIGAAGYLSKVGVTVELQNSLVDEAVNYGVPLILTGLAFIWSIAQKRFSNGMIQIAHEAPPESSLTAVAKKVNDKITVGTSI